MVELIPCQIESLHRFGNGVVFRFFGSKKHIDDYFAKKAPDPEIKEWYSTQDMQEKFGMTLTAIYSFVSKNAIPKKKVGIMVYYSKKHVDIAKGLIAPKEPKYYTMMPTFFLGMAFFDTKE